MLFLPYLPYIVIIEGIIGMKDNRRTDAVGDTDCYFIQCIIDDHNIWLNPSYIRRETVRQALGVSRRHF